MEVYEYHHGEGSDPRVPDGTVMVQFKATGLKKDWGGEMWASPEVDVVLPLEDAPEIGGYL